jgi:polyphosphate kinase
MPARAANQDARLLNRELSWVEFNARVLDLAADQSEPLLERVKFCSIFSSNLDEFVMVRLAGLLGQEAAGFAVRSSDGLSPSQALVALKARLTELVSRQAKLWRRDLQPALAAEGIEIVTIDQCSAKELGRLETIYKRDIYPVLTPLAVGAGQPFPYISGLSNSLAVLAADPESGEERFARVKVPEGLDRFVDAGSRLVPLESVISHFLPSLFPGMERSPRPRRPGCCSGCERGWTSTTIRSTRSTACSTSPT